MKKAVFEQLFEDPYSDVIYAAYKAFWLKKSDEGVIWVDFSLFKRVPELLNERKFIRKDEVKNTKGTSYPMMDKMKQDNSFKMLILPGRKYLVDKVSLENALSAQDSLITKKEAGLILGIRAGTVASLIHAGILTPFRRGSFRYERLSLQVVLDGNGSLQGTIS